MKWIYVFILSIFSCLVFGQDMKIGFLDSDAVVKEMEEFQYLDSIRILVYDKNYKLGELMMRELEKKYNGIIKKTYCATPIVQQKAVKELEMYQQNILEFENEINEFDSLYKKEIAIYLKSEVRNITSQYNFDIILDKEVVFYRKENLDITKEVVQKVKSRKISEWKNDSFLQFVENMKDKYNLPVKKVKELMELKFSILD